MDTALNHPLLNSLAQIHTTPLGKERIRRNLHLNDADDPVAWCLRQIEMAGADSITREGKNWYVRRAGCVITINARSLTIITAHCQ